MLDGKGLVAEESFCGSPLFHFVRRGQRMKFMHLADLHLGKRVNDFSMLEDQRYALEQVLGIVRKERVAGVLIAGDIYDRQVPSVEAMGLLDDFLTKLSGEGVPVYMVGGNHDSIERVSFGARLMTGSGIHMATQYNGEVDTVTVKDEYGMIDIYLLPFLKPAHVRAVWKEQAEEIHTYQEALDFVTGKIVRDERNRSILVAHQYVSGAAVCDSEERSIGGLDEVDVSCFDGFDYVALGHLHGPQSVGRDTVRYAGTLLKYSFSEVNHKKSVTLVEMAARGVIRIDTRQIEPLHEMRKIRGSYMEVTDRSHYENTDTQDYVHITLTDEEDIFDAVGKLRAVYPNLMKLEYDNARTRSAQTVMAPEDIQMKPPLRLCEELFALQNNKPMGKEQKIYMEELVREIWEEGKDAESI